MIKMIIIITTGRYVIKMSSNEIINNEKMMQNRKNGKRCKSKQQGGNFQFKGMTLKQYFGLQQKLMECPNLKIDQLDEDGYCSSKEGGTPCFNQLEIPHDLGNNMRIKVKTEAIEDQFLFHHKKSQNYYNFMKSGEAVFKNKMSVVGYEKTLQKNKQTTMPELKKNTQKYQNNINNINNINHNNINHNNINHNNINHNNINHNNINHNNINHNNINHNNINHNNINHNKQRVPSISNNDKPTRIQNNRSTLSSFYQQDKKNKMLNKLKVDKEKTNNLKFTDLFYLSKYGKKFNIDLKQTIK